MDLRFALLELIMCVVVLFFPVMTSFFKFFNSMFVVLILFMKMIILLFPVVTFFF
jgi:hypothetical protein